MKPSVYIETTIPSYLTAWRSPELLMAANQEAKESGGMSHAKNMSYLALSS